MIYRFQYLIQIIAIRIGNEYLSELIITDQTDNLRYPLRIQLIKYIIQKQSRNRSPLPCQLSILRQLQRDKESLPLSLRTDTTNQIIIQCHIQIVFMNTY